MYQLIDNNYNSTGKFVCMHTLRLRLSIAIMAIIAIVDLNQLLKSYRCINWHEAKVYVHNRYLFSVYKCIIIVIYHVGCSNLNFCVSVVNYSFIITPTGIGNLWINTKVTPTNSK